MSVFSYVSVANCFRKKKARVDSSVFRMHYRITYALFLVCSLLVTAKEFFGSPISCISKSNSIMGMLNQYCYIMSTFSVPVAPNHTVGKHIAYVGTGSYDNNRPYAHHYYDDVEEGFVRIHSYYLWVPIVLFLQAVSFYVTHFVWKKYDDGSYESIADGMGNFSLNRAEKDEKRKVAVEYFLKFQGTHEVWSYVFFCCEIVNLLVALGNLYFIDYFLGGTFLSYGSDVINFPEMDPEFRVDPMSRIFPKMAKCTFRKFGPSGTLEVHDAFCLLAVNIINEKIYIFLWFWLIGLIILSALWAVYRIAMIFSSGLRHKLLSHKGKMAGPGTLHAITDRVKVGDWFLIYQLGYHMEPLVYSDFLKDLATEFQNAAPTLERKPMLMSN